MGELEGRDVDRALVGRTWQRTETLCEAPLAGLWALLDRPPEEWTARELPPLAHWLYFLPRTRQSLLGADGHPAVDEITPPAHLPRRMWGGGAIDFIAPLKLDDRVTRDSTVLHAQHKAGRTGELLVMTVEHRLSTAAGLALVERQDLVYRAAAAPGVTTAPAAAAPPVASPPAAAPPAASPGAAANADSAAAPTARRRSFRADPALLFRFSALTFNAHRIHYDRDYCRQVEGYPALVVHGPLIAMLLLDHAAGLAGPAGASGAAVRRFEFRNHSPLFEGREFWIEALVEAGAASAAVAAIDADGRRAATGVVSFADGTS